MSYEFVCIYIHTRINLQIDIHKHIHMPGGTTVQSLTNAAALFVMRKPKFLVPEDRQASSVGTKHTGEITAE